MAIMYADGFDNYASTNGSDYETRWPFVVNTSSNCQWDPTGGRFGGGAFLALNADAADIFRSFPATTTADGYVCFAFWFKHEPIEVTDATSILIRLYNSSTINNSPVALRTNGKIGLYKMESNPALVVETAQRYDDSQWHFIEAYMVFDQIGTFIVYIDGVEVINFSGDTEDSNDGTVGSFRLESANGAGGVNFWIDDLIIYDDSVGETGEPRSTVDFPLGPIQIETLRPSSTGTQQDFTAAVGSTQNYENVDEIVTDSTGSYNTASTYGSVDSFGFGNITSTYFTTDIVSVVHNIHARKDGTDDMYLRGTVVSSGSTQNLVPVEVPGAWFYTQEVIPYDPATSTYWTTAGIDAAEFGYATSSST